MCYLLGGRQVFSSLKLVYHDLGPFIAELIDASFHKFTLPEVLRVARLKDDLNILELFHGPTLAFKDLALSVVGQLYSYFLSKRKRHVNVVIGTNVDRRPAIHLLAQQTQTSC